MITIEEACHRAFHQLNVLGCNAIGVRGTPVISVWDMRPKWEKWGQWFTYLGTDGDIEMKKAWYCDLEDRQEYQKLWAQEPLMLRLFYIRIDNKVIQLAWIDPKAEFRSSRMVEGEKMSVSLVH